MTTTSKLLSILAGLGILVSVYLVMKTVDPSSVACSIGGGCETVLSSKYARILNIPVAAFGVAWYVALLGLVWKVYVKRWLTELYFKIWVVLGLAFSLYLLALEAFVIKAYCTWCLVSLGLIMIIFVLTFFRKESVAR